MGLRSTLGKWFTRSDPVLDLATWASYFTYGGLSYPFLPALTMGEREEAPHDSFEGYVQGIYRSNPVVFACMVTRMMLFAEARFQWRRMRQGRPGDLFGDESLRLLEEPWPNGTTGDLLSRVMQDADIAGNFYARRDGNRIDRLRPDWTTIVLGSRRDVDAEHPGFAIDAEVVGYIFKPGGKAARDEPVPLRPEEVCHYAPIPDPIARFRGMSWLTPLIREIVADNAATQHKRRFFEKGASRNLAVSLDPLVKGEEFADWVEKFKEAHPDLTDAYRTLFLGGGATVNVVGADLKESDFAAVQGAGETRICAAARVPPIIVGISEGLDAATYSNYGEARRAFADLTMRPLWRNAAGSFQRIVPPPRGAELWYDHRDIAFLQEDQKDAAEILQVQAQTIASLVKEGYTAESAKAAIVAGDLSQLVHTGLVSVQLQPPGQAVLPSDSTGNGNGNTPDLEPAAAD